MDSKIKIYMGIPSTGDRVDEQCYALRRLEKEYGDKIEFVYPDICARRIFHDFARNNIVDEFLDTDCDLLWFLDSDVVPKYDILDIVVDHYDKWMVAGAPYPVWMKNKVVFVTYQYDGEKFVVHDVPRNGQDYGWTDGIATGCIFIKRQIFDLLEKPYFEFKYRNEDRFITEGEDIGFIKKVNKLGYRFFTKFNSPCRHYKTVDLLEINNYAIDFSNANIERYSEDIKKQLGPALNKLRGKTKPQIITQPKLVIP